MKKKCKIPSSSSSSSSSSSCIESPKKKINKRVSAKKNAVSSADNSVTSPKSRSSIYRGVTRHRWTGRFEAHLWDKATWNNIQNKRGRQIYLGAYDNEEDAAQTYDLAALKYWGTTAILNFPLESYTEELEKMQNMTKEEYLASLRRRSNGFSRGVSKYRGVARHHQNGRWEARIGRVTGNKYLYLGTYNTQEEAAAAYDMAAIEFRGPNAVTNFDISNYADKLKKILPDLQIKPVEVQVQLKQETTPEVSSNIKQDSVMHNQPEEFLLTETTSPKFELNDFVDSEPMVVMDPTEEHQHPWDLCLDTSFDALQIPDLPFERSSEFLGLSDEKGFEDDIELIFDGPINDDMFLLDEGCGPKENAKVADQDLNGMNKLTSCTSSSSLSTMTSSASSSN